MLTHAYLASLRFHKAAREEGCLAKGHHDAGTALAREALQEVQGSRGGLQGLLHVQLRAFAGHHGRLRLQAQSLCSLVHICHFVRRVLHWLRRSFGETSLAWPGDLPLTSTRSPQTLLNTDVVFCTLYITFTS